MYKVLIVDDENLVRLAFRTIVEYEKYGFTVCGTAADGQEGLKLCEKYHPDLVITDIKMPRMDGITFIEKLTGTGFAGQIVLISNYDDFELVRRGMQLGAQDYLLKVTITTEQFVRMLTRVKKNLDECKNRRQEQEAIQGTLERIKEKDRVMLWQSIILSNSLTVQEIPMSIFSEGGICFSVIRIVHYGDVMKVCSQADATLIDFAVKNIVTELMGDKKVCIGNLKEGQYFVISQDNQTAESANLFARKLCTTLNKYLNICVLVLYQASVKSPEELWNILQKKSRVEDLAFMCLKSTTVCFSNLEAPGNWSVSISQLADQLYHCVKALEMEESFSIIEQKIKECIDLQVSRQEVLQKWSAVLLRMEERMVGSPHSDRFHDTIQQFGRIDSIATLSSLLKGLFEQITSDVKVDYEQSGSHEVEQILQYIHSHMDEKISLTQLANYVNFNETYMCKVFRTHTGMSIVNYINKVKMEQAAVLLRESNMLLKAIASSLGFSDQFYFNKMFRKHYGMSPSEYRRQNTDYTKHM